MTLGIKSLMDPERVRIAEDKYKQYVPHPAHDDSCGHGRNNFVMTVHGCDIHRYWLDGSRMSLNGPFTNENTTYCVRYGSGCGDYLSGIQSLDGAIKNAKIQREGMQNDI